MLVGANPQSQIGALQICATIRAKIRATKTQVGANRLTARSKTGYSRQPDSRHCEENEIKEWVGATFGEHHTLTPDSCHSCQHPIGWRAFWRESTSTSFQSLNRLVL